MSIKKLSKIGLTLLLAASFSMPFSFPARADWSTSDSQHLANIDTNTANTASRLSTIINSYLADIKSDVAAIDTNVQNIKTAVANTITTTLNGIFTTLTSIKGYVDGLEGYVDGLEGKLDNIYARQATINTNIITAGSYLESIDSTLTTSGTDVTNIYNLLNTYTNTHLSNISANIAIIRDNLTVNRNSTSGGSVNVTYSGGTTTYNLTSFTVRSLSYANNEITFTTSTRYGNWLGIYITKMNQLYDIMTLGFNKVYGWMYLVEYDLAFIGEELHNVYTNITSFKEANHKDITDFATANHNDITAFKNANHTDILAFKSSFDNWVVYWQDLAKSLYIMYDNIVYARRRTSDQSNTVDLGTHFGVPVTYNLSSYIFRTYSISDGQLVTTEGTYYSNFRDVLTQRILEVEGLLRTYFYHMINNNLASNISNNVAALDTNLTNYSNAEQQIQNRVQNAISTFIPDTQLFGGFVAIAWCSQYLQQVYVALGSYGTVIMIGLLLGVCMQFIGYFRYKY